MGGVTFGGLPDLYCHHTLRGCVVIVALVRVPAERLVRDSLTPM